VLHQSQCAYALVYPKLIDTLLLYLVWVWRDPLSSFVVFDWCIPLHLRTHARYMRPEHACCMLVTKAPNGRSLIMLFNSWHPPGLGLVVCGVWAIAIG
jgi:hypothetical protein